MNCDLHIHSKDCSDGRFYLRELFQAARERGLDLISITDHDSIDCQERALELARAFGISYITGVELNIRFELGDGQAKATPLDILGYGFDFRSIPLLEKTRFLRAQRINRVYKIVENLNPLLIKNGHEPLGDWDVEKIISMAKGAVGRPHIADYLVYKGIVQTRAQAFLMYLDPAHVPKYPLSLEEASRLIRGAGGKVIIAHPSDPKGTSLWVLERDVQLQLKIIERHMLTLIDGIECWHSRHDARTSREYHAFAKINGLLCTGGSDCHQNPVILGSVKIPQDAIDELLESIKDSNGYTPN